MTDNTLTLRLSPEDQLELVRRRFGGADIADDAAAAVPEPEPVVIAPKWLSIRTTSKTLKVTCTLAAEPFRDVVVPEQQSSVSIYVEVDSQTVRAMVKAKAIRKVAAAITAGGDPVVILVGKMAGNEITQAGLSAVPRTPAPLKPDGDEK